MQWIGLPRPKSDPCNSAHFKVPCVYLFHQYQPRASGLYQADDEIDPRSGEQAGGGAPHGNADKAKGDDDVAAYVSVYRRASRR